MCDLLCYWIYQDLCDINGPPIPIDSVHETKCTLDLPSILYIPSSTILYCEDYRPFIMGPARYRPIDDRARYWAKIFFGGGKMNLENFQRKKKKNIVGIRTHARSFNSPVQLPLAHRNTAEEVCFNHFFMIKLFLLLALTSPNPNPSQVLALGHQDTAVEFRYTANSCFSSLLTLTSPNPNSSEVLALALTLSLDLSLALTLSLDLSLALYLALSLSLALALALALAQA